MGRAQLSIIYWKARRTPVAICVNEKQLDSFRRETNIVFYSAEAVAAYVQSDRNSYDQPSHTPGRTVWDIVAEVWMRFGWWSIPVVVALSLGCVAISHY
jgi:hypothetical protein